MTELENRLIRLEQQVAANDKRLQADQIALAQLAQAMRTQQTGGYGGGSSGASVYTIAPVVISAGGNVTGQTVNVIIGGVTTALPGTYTVYNKMAAATVATAGKTILVGANPDGTFTAITQSC
jgi:hypothetical protein